MWHFILLTIADLVPDPLPHTGLLQPDRLVVPDGHDAYTGQTHPGYDHQTPCQKPNAHNLLIHSKREVTLPIIYKIVMKIK